MAPHPTSQTSPWLQSEPLAGEPAILLIIQEGFTLLVHILGFWHSPATGKERLRFLSACAFMYFCCRFDGPGHCWIVAVCSFSRSAKLLALMHWELKPSSCSVVTGIWRMFPGHMRSGSGLSCLGFWTSLAPRHCHSYCQASLSCLLRTRKAPGRSGSPFFSSQRWPAVPVVASSCLCTSLLYVLFETKPRS